MEKEINITEILKDKPQGTKLYDWLYNRDVELDTISTTDTETVVWCTNETDNNTTCHRGYSEFGTVRGCHDGLQILLPSKEKKCVIGANSIGRKVMSWLAKITCILSLKSLRIMPTQDLKASIIFGKKVTKKTTQKKKHIC